VPVTLTQLGAFVLVARLGSVRAAANALGVSEPAVSQALAALRKHLDDELVVRTSSGMALTAGGQRLLSIASQMVSLGAEAEAAIRTAQGAPELLRVVADSVIAELVAPSLLEAFRNRTGGVETTVGVATTAEMGALLHERMADVALGPNLAGESLPGVESHPVMRCQLVVVAATSRAPAMARVSWLVDSSGTDPGVQGAGDADPGVPQPSSGAGRRVRRGGRGAGARAPGRAGRPPRRASPGRRAGHSGPAAVVCERAVGGSAVAGRRLAASLPRYASGDAADAQAGPGPTPEPLPPPGLRHALELTFVGPNARADSPSNRRGRSCSGSR
jgi:DNA-binding transcriptional LysR family regulator